MKKLKKTNNVYLKRKMLTTPLWWRNIKNICLFIKGKLEWS